MFGHGYGEPSLCDAGRDVLCCATPDGGEQWNMQTSNAKRNFNCDDTRWVLLGEFPLMDFLLNRDQRDEPVVEFMLQTLWELGMSPNDTENIARTMARFTEEASVHTKQGKLEFPGLMRIFCQKKMTDDEDSVKTTQPYHIKQGEKQKQIFSEIGTKRTGGWAYFIIERGEELRSDPSAISKSYIELYLYQEGD